MAVVMDSTSDDDTNSSYDAFADDITEEELNNMVEDYQESMNIETNLPGRISLQSEPLRKELVVLDQIHGNLSGYQASGSKEPIASKLLYWADRY